MSQIFVKTSLVLSRNPGAAAPPFSVDRPAAAWVADPRRKGAKETNSCKWVCYFPIHTKERDTKEAKFSLD